MKFKLYMLYLLAIFSYLIISSVLLNKVYFSSFFLKILICVGFGIFIGIPNIIAEKNKKGIWIFNKWNLVIIIPVLLLLLWESTLSFPFNSIYFNDTSNQLIMILLGYSISTAFKKQES